ncbi:MAG: hypothetical protein EPO12_04515 [Aquabacterium sp.]|nr:MAG: hypothetical protein EPO12_04515 [Aquabacterium sp.]
MERTDPGMGAQGQRRAALLLHSLSGADRAAVLQRFPQDVQARLGELVRELEELGIPPRAAEGIELDAPVALPADGLDALRRLSAAQAAVALHGQSTQTVAAILSLEDWPWQAAYLETLAPHLRQKLQALQRAGGIAPALRRALLEQFTQALQQAPDTRRSAAAADRVAGRGLIARLVGKRSRS